MLRGRDDVAGAGEKGGQLLYRKRTGPVGADL